MKKILDGAIKFIGFLRSDHKLTVGFLLLLTIIVLAVFEPVINAYRLGGLSPIEVGVYPRLLRESYEHPLGTDLYGRDILSMMLYGLKYTLYIGFVSGFLTMAVAIVVALVAGYKGGLYEEIIGFLTNVILVIPTWPILVSIVAFTRVDLCSMCLIITAFSWPWPTRTLKAQILSIKEREYIWLARMSGMNDIEIIFKEILPNLLPFIGVSFSYAVIGAISAETGIRMVGLGPTYIPTLGLMVYWSIKWGYLGGQRYLTVIAPIILLTMIFASMNLINIGLDERYNPRLKKVTGI